MAIDIDMTSFFTGLCAGWCLAVFVLYSLFRKDLKNADKKGSRCITVKAADLQDP